MFEKRRRTFAVVLPIFASHLGARLSINDSEVATNKQKLSFLCLQLMLVYFFFFAGSLNEQKVNSLSVHSTLASSVLKSSCVTLILTLLDQIFVIVYDFEMQQIRHYKNP